MKKEEKTKEYLLGFTDGYQSNIQQFETTKLKIIGILRQIGTVDGDEQMEKVIRLIRGL